MTFIDRPFRIDADYAALRALIMESYRRAPKLSNWPLARLDSLRYGKYWREELQGERPWTADVHVWADAGSGQVLGVCHSEEAHQGVIEIHPDARGLEDAMFAWLEERYRRLSPPEAPPFETWVFEKDRFRKELLRRRGWQPGPACGVTRIRTMDLAIAGAPAAPGYVLRLFDAASAADREALAALTNAVFPNAHFEADSYRSLEQAPTWNTHWVAVAPDGRFASCAGIWYAPEICHGQFEPVGTRAEFRRLGLARATMTAALRHLLDLGAQIVCVDTGYDNNANALYAGLGFTEVDVFECWHRPHHA